MLTQVIFILAAVVQASGLTLKAEQDDEVYVMSGETAQLKWTITENKLPNDVLFSVCIDTVCFASGTITSFNKVGSNAYTNEVTAAYVNNMHVLNITSLTASSNILDKTITATARVSTLTLSETVIVGLAGDPEFRFVVPAPEYFVEIGHLNTVVAYVFGKPKPAAFWSFKNINTSVASGGHGDDGVDHVHTFTYILPNVTREDCNTTLYYSFTRPGGASLARSSIFYVVFTPDAPSNFMAFRDSARSVSASWDRIVSGNCSISYNVKFFNKNNNLVKMWITEDNYVSFEYPTLDTAYRITSASIVANHLLDYSPEAKSIVPDRVVGPEFVTKLDSILYAEENGHLLVNYTGFGYPKPLQNVNYLGNDYSNASSHSAYSFNGAVEETYNYFFKLPISTTNHCNSTLTYSLSRVNATTVSASSKVIVRFTPLSPTNFTVRRVAAKVVTASWNAIASGMCAVTYSVELIDNSNQIVKKVNTTGTTVTLELISKEVSANVTKVRLVAHFLLKSSASQVIVLPERIAGPSFVTTLDKIIYPDENANVTLNFTGYGVPKPMVQWRYNGWVAVGDFRHQSNANGIEDQYWYSITPTFTAAYCNKTLIYSLSRKNGTTVTNSSTIIVRLNPSTPSNSVANREGEYVVTVSWDGVFSGDCAGTYTVELINNLGNVERTLNTAGTSARFTFTTMEVSTRIVKAKLVASFLSKVSSPVEILVPAKTGPVFITKLMSTLEFDENTSPSVQFDGYGIPQPLQRWNFIGINSYDNSTSTSAVSGLYNIYTYSLTLPQLTTANCMETLTYYLSRLSGSTISASSNVIVKFTPSNPSNFNANREGEMVVTTSWNSIPAGNCVVTYSIELIDNTNQVAETLNTTTTSARFTFASMNASTKITKARLVAHFMMKSSGVQVINVPAKDGPIFVVKLDNTLYPDEGTSPLLRIVGYGLPKPLQSWNFMGVVANDTSSSTASSNAAAENQYNYSYQMSTLTVNHCNKLLFYSLRRLSGNTINAQSTIVVTFTPSQPTGFTAGREGEMVITTSWNAVASGDCIVTYSIEAIDNTNNVGSTLNTTKTSARFEFNTMEDSTKISKLRLVAKFINKTSVMQEILVPAKAGPVFITTLDSPLYKDINTSPTLSFVGYGIPKPLQTWNFVGVNVNDASANTNSNNTAFADRYNYSYDMPTLTINHCNKTLTYSLTRLSGTTVTQTSTVIVKFTPSKPSNFESEREGELVVATTWNAVSSGDCLVTYCIELIDNSNKIVRTITTTKNSAKFTFSSPDVSTNISKARIVAKFEGKSSPPHEIDVPDKDGPTFITPLASTLRLQENTSPTLKVIGYGIPKPLQTWNFMGANSNDASLNTASSDATINDQYNYAYTLPTLTINHCNKIITYSLSRTAKTVTKSSTIIVLFTPSTPSNLAANREGEMVIMISWNAVASGDCVVTYTIELIDSSSNVKSTLNTTTTSARFEFNTMEASTIIAKARIVAKFEGKSSIMAEVLVPAKAGPTIVVPLSSSISYDVGTSPTLNIVGFGIPKPLQTWNFIGVNSTDASINTNSSIAPTANQYNYGFTLPTLTINHCNKNLKYSLTRLSGTTVSASTTVIVKFTPSAPIGFTASRDGETVVKTSWNVIASGDCTVRYTIELIDNSDNVVKTLNTAVASAQFSFNTMEASGNVSKARLVATFEGKSSPAQEIPIPAKAGPIFITKLNPTIRYDINTSPTLRIVGYGIPKPLQTWSFMGINSNDASLNTASSDATINDQYNYDYTLPTLTIDHCNRVITYSLTRLSGSTITETSTLIVKFTPSKPSGFTANREGETVIKLSWNSVYSGNCVVQYGVTLYDNANNVLSTLTVSTTSARFVLTQVASTNVAKARLVATFEGKSSAIQEILVPAKAGPIIVTPLPSTIYHDVFTSPTLGVVVFGIPKPLQTWRFMGIDSADASSKTASSNSVNPNEYNYNYTLPTLNVNHCNEVLTYSFTRLSGTTVSKSSTLVVKFTPSIPSGFTAKREGETIIKTSWNAVASGKCTITYVVDLLDNNNNSVKTLTPSTLTSATFVFATSIASTNIVKARVTAKFMDKTSEITIPVPAKSGPVFIKKVTDVFYGDVNEIATLHIIGFGIPKPLQRWNFMGIDSRDASAKTVSSNSVNSNEYNYNYTLPALTVNHCNEVLTYFLSRDTNSISATSQIVVRFTPSAPTSFTTDREGERFITASWNSVPSGKCVVTYSLEFCNSANQVVKTFTTTTTSARLEFNTHEASANIITVKLKATFLTKSSTVQTSQVPIKDGPIIVTPLDATLYFNENTRPTLTIIGFGIPKPTITWNFDGVVATDASTNTDSSDAVVQDQYSYSYTIPTLTRSHCNKTLTYSLSRQARTISLTSKIIVRFDPVVPSNFISRLEGDTTIVSSWDAVSAGQCLVTYSVQLINNDDKVIRNVNTTSTSVSFQFQSASTVLNTTKSGITASFGAKSSPTYISCIPCLKENDCSNERIAVIATLALLLFIAVVIIIVLAIFIARK